jgi:cell division septation protein DedD
MRITCPKCQFKGLIDTAPLVVETQVACVRCGITFEAVLLEGEVQAFLLANNDDDEEDSRVQEAASDAGAQMMTEESADAEDVLALPQTHEAVYQMDEPAPAFEDVLTVWGAGVESSASEYAEADEAEGRAQETAIALKEVAVLEEADAQPLAEAQPFVEAQSPQTAADEDETSFKFGRSVEAPTADYARQNSGMRLMRISPLWLLACGMTFISVIVFSNQFAKPAEPVERAAASYTAPANQSANQSPSQPTAAPALANSAAASTSVPQSAQAEAAASVESKTRSAAAEEQPDAKAQAETQHEAGQSVAPAVETKQDERAATVQSAGEKAGGLTLQLGSYNVIEQANERLAKLRAAGFEARVVAVELPKRGTWYRVQAGRFTSREEATRYGNELKAKGAADNFIVTDAPGEK